MMQMLCTLRRWLRGLEPQVRGRLQGSWLARFQPWLEQRAMFRFQRQPLARGVAAGDVHVGEIVARSGAAHATACDIAPAKPGLWLKRLRCRGDEDTPIIL
mgnify:CR=1 FL=1